MEKEFKDYVISPLQLEPKFLIENQFWIKVLVTYLFSGNTAMADSEATGGGQGGENPLKGIKLGVTRFLAFFEKVEIALIMLDFGTLSKLKRLYFSYIINQDYFSSFKQQSSTSVSVTR